MAERFEESLPLILCAHDNRALLDRVATILNSQYRVATAAEPATAFAAAARQRPQLILCAVRLMAADSQYLWQTLRGDPELGNVPLILVMDGGNTPLEPDVDVLYPPFSDAELLGRVAVNLRFARRRARAAVRDAVLTAEAATMLRRLDIVLAHLPFGLTMVNPDGQIVYANPARERLLRFRDQPRIGEHLAARLPALNIDGTPLMPDEYPIRRALKGEFVTDLEIQYDSGEGPPHWLRTSGIPIKRPDGSVQYAIGVAVDVTGEVQAREALLKLKESLEVRVRAEIEERLKTEEALRQVQKMQTIGQLTGGIAHDFNNLLQVMLGNLEAVERQLHADAQLDRPRIDRQVTAALRAVERATQMTQQLLAFSRSQPLNPKPLDANELVLRMTELFRRTLGESVAIETVIEPNLRPAYADQNQLEATLLNLAVNARDAMPAGGRLTIETANYAFDQSAGDPWEEFASGEYVMIAVTDTGTGIPKEVMPRIFEPFFTTKEVGRGTGLGLSQAYGFAKQSGGNIKIYSEVGVGTTVMLYLPAGPLASEVDKHETQPDARRQASGELILVVEDDPAVRAFSVETLLELGYRVLEAADAVAALRQLEIEPLIRLMFTDVGLPGAMTGRQLADMAQARWPNLKVLFTTGYARNAIVHHGRLDPGVELITKPFTGSALAARVRELLDNLA
jgi:signal transduction histidine kinase